MTPQEKAVELYNRYFDLGRDFTRGASMKQFAKLCALIAVDEMINVIKDLDNWAYTYWIEVKQEIEKL
jgi:hypothetical protein